MVVLFISAAIIAVAFASAAIAWAGVMLALIRRLPPSGIPGQAHPGQELRDSFAEPPSGP